MFSFALLVEQKIKSSWLPNCWVNTHFRMGDKKTSLLTWKMFIIAIKNTFNWCTVLEKSQKSADPKLLLRGTPRNSVELQGTPRNSEELHGTPWNSMELRGTPRNSVELQFIINYLINFKIIFTFYEYFLTSFRCILGLFIDSILYKLTPWNSMELHGTPRNSKELRGPPRSSEVLRGSQNFNLFLINFYNFFVLVHTQEYYRRTF